MGNFDIKLNIYYYNCLIKFLNLFNFIFDLNLFFQKRFCRNVPSVNYSAGVYFFIPLVMSFRTFGVHN